MERGSGQTADEVRQVVRYLSELLNLLDEVRRQLNAPPERDFLPAFSRN